MRRIFAGLTGTLLLLALVALGCSGSDEPASDQPAAQPGAETTLSVSSPSFQELVRPRKRIPKENTCYEGDASPPLDWTGVPPGAQSLALIVEDRENGWTHWVLYDIPVSLTGLPEGVPMSAPELPDGTRQGTNDDQNIGYNGPCPQPGILIRSQEGVKGTAKPTEYHFVLYALDTELDLDTGATQGQVESAMKGHILAQAETLGKFMAPPKLDDFFVETPSAQTSNQAPA